MVGHDLEAIPDGSGYKIDKKDDIVLEIKSEPSGKRQTVENIGGLVDMPLMSKSLNVRIVPGLQYNVKKNKLIPDYPAIYPTRNFKVKGGDFKKLA